MTYLARLYHPRVASCSCLVIGPVFVARDLSGFRTARKGGGEWAGQKCCNGYGRCVLRDCSSGMSGELSQGEAAEMLGVSERTFRRWRDRLRDEGPEGLRDRRIGKPSSRRAAVEEIGRMLGLYEERYDGFTAKHFHEQLV